MSDDTGDRKDVTDVDDFIRRENRRRGRGDDGDDKRTSGGLFDEATEDDPLNGYTG